MFGRKQRTTVAEADRTGGWQVGRGTFEGRPMVVRFNEAMRTVTDRASWPVRIGIAVPLRLPDDRGLPVADESDQLNAIEDAMTARFADRAVLIAVITTNGMREFVLHSQTQEWIAQAHRGLVDATVDHELQIIVIDDPTWSMYDSLIR